MAADVDEEPEDDPSVGPDLILYRWVPPQHWRRRDGQIECRDGAFKNFPNPELLRMSIVLDDTLRDDGREPSAIIEGRRDFGLVALTARQVRDIEQRVIRSATEDEPAHGDVWGEKPGAVRRRLASAAEWVIEPSEDAEPS